LRRRLRRLQQQASALHDVAFLTDGTQVTLGPGERLAAFQAEMAGEEHPLLDLLPQTDLEASPELRTMVEFFRAFRGSGEGEETKA
jgi:hypothetical protein